MITTAAITDRLDNLTSLFLAITIVMIPLYYSVSILLVSEQTMLLWCLAAGSKIVMVSVTDDRAQEEVMFGPNGALAGVHDGSIVIDLRTVSPDVSPRLFRVWQTGPKMVYCCR